MLSRNKKSVLYPVIMMCSVILLSACGIISGPQDHRQIEFTEKPSPHGENKFPNWPEPPLVIEKTVSKAITAGQGSGKAIDHKAHQTAAGVSGADKVLVTFPGLHKEIKFKWKAALSESDGLENYDNSIARNLAAYQIQKLFLDPEDYVIPTSMAFCIPSQHYSQFLGLKATPQLAGSDCVLGNASVWMLDVQLPEVVFEEQHFLTDPNYAYFLSNLNIVAYLVEHRDGRSGNILASKDHSRPQLFFIDNDTTFGTNPYNPFARNWNIIRVPALRKETIDRLRQVKRKDLDFLGVVAQLDKGSDNVFRNVVPGKNRGAKKPVRISKNSVQFGLTKEQLSDVWMRLKQLIKKVDSGEIPVF